ncbi:MAG: ATP-binding protein [Thermaceae bacterium]|nr:ATP-binding protein [Thermaceae bacterium]
MQQRHLMTAAFSLETLLASPNVPGIEGIRIFDGSRDPWGYDESANFLKHTLCQIEVDRLQAIGNRVDREGEIQKGSLVDPWKPLRELISNLLPHMTFERIDGTNRDQVRVLFRVHRLDTLVDLDELSSGEKSIIQMFYPLVERDIKSLVGEIDTGPRAVDRPELCVLIDEPELHLHPNLQLKVLDYLRVLTSHQRTQVIVATHSPTIVEGATYDELFLLRPLELVQPEENQLVRVAQDEERLAALRTLFGSTHNLTSLQPVIVVEGSSDERSGHTISDRRLYRALHAGFDRATVVSGGGKRECVNLARALQKSLVEFSSQLKVVALLDKDTDACSEGLVKLLPVSMIENFLVDPDVIFEAIESVRERTSFRTVDDIADALDRLLTTLETHELGRRTAAALGSMHFYPPNDPSTLRNKALKFIDDFEKQYSEASIESARLSATQEIEKIRASKRRREEFDGKKILAEFFRHHLHSSTLSRQVFAFYAARRARRRNAVVSFFDSLFKELM